MLHDEMADIFFGEIIQQEIFFKGQRDAGTPEDSSLRASYISSDKMSIVTALDFSGSIAVALDYSLSEKIKMRGLLRTGACQPDHSV